MQWPLATSKMFLCDTLCVFCRVRCFDVFCHIAILLLKELEHARQGLACLYFKGYLTERCGRAMRLNQSA